LYFGFASVFSPKISSTSEGILKWPLFILALKGKDFWPRMYKATSSHDFPEHGIREIGKTEEY
jgi:hypothetical protein